MAHQVICDNPDLTYPYWVNDAVWLNKPDLIINAAGYNMNVAGSSQHAYDIFRLTTLFALNVNSSAIRMIEKGKAARIDFNPKIIHLMASCAYPLDANILSEELILTGRPHSSVEAHGYGKRNVQLSCKFAHQQFGLRAVTICPPTLFGPGEPLDESKTKVVGSILWKILRAKREKANEVQLWGSGEVYRDIMYVKDAADIIRDLVSKDATYINSRMPLNLGGYTEFTIKELAEKIASIVGFSGKILWDKTKPDGQFRKRLKFERMENVLGLKVSEIAWTPFEDAIMETAKDFEGRMK